MHFIEFEFMLVRNSSIAPRCSGAVAAGGLACLGVRQLLTMLGWDSPSMLHNVSYTCLLHVEVDVQIK